MKNLIDHFKQARNDFLKIANQISPNKQEIVCAGDWTDKKTTPVKLIKIETRHYQGVHLEQIKKLK